VTNETHQLNTASTSLTWSAYHELLREKYAYSPRLREWFFEKKWFFNSDEENNNFIDPTTISYDEWQHFIGIAFRSVYKENMEYISKEATLIDFVDVDGNGKHA